MPKSGGQKPLESSILHGPVQEFTDYCEAEFERRGNSGEPFDEGVYREAMELALGKLRKLKEKGQG